MKKNLFILAVAAVALASCSSDDTIAENSNVGKNQQKEIAFFPVTQPTTRAAVDGTTFPTTSDIQVVAYDATTGEDYFDATTFSNVSATTNWAGGKYWPFTPATINFLAYSGLNGDADTPTDEITGATWGQTTPTELPDVAKVTLVMADNSSNQKDLMYACGTGTVTQTDGRALTFPTNVPMQFKHAQAWVKFYVTAGDATTASNLTVNSITLNSVSCGGTFTVTHENYDKTYAQRTDPSVDPAGSLDGKVTGVWTAYNGNVNSFAAVENGSWTFKVAGSAAEDYYFGSLMVVPNQGMASFTINYTIDGNNYNYTYTPASTSLEQATKYTYNITLTLHEILIAPTVENWTNGGSTDVGI